MSNSDILRALWAAVNAEGASALRRFLSADYVRHGSDRDYSLDEWVQTMTERDQAFPDNKNQVLDIVAEGDRLAYRWCADGTHRDTYQRIPATGRKVHAEGITISQFRDGLITEEWASWNKTSVLHSLGVMPIL